MDSVAFRVKLKVASKYLLSNLVMIRFVGAGQTVGAVFDEYET